MASVNVTCTTCVESDPCERCRAIARSLRSAGHSITCSSRYDTLRAATVGAYRFDACVLPIASDERAIIDAAATLLSRARVALVIEPGAPLRATLPKDFAVIEAADWQRRAFPTEWIASERPPLPQIDETQSLEELSVPPTDLDPARRRLKSVVRRAQRELGAAGFQGEVRLDLLAALEDEIAWAKMSGACFGLVLVHLAKRSNDSKPPEDIDGALALLKQALEPEVRAGDLIAQGTDSILLVVGEAAIEQTKVAANRVKKAIRKVLKGSAGVKTLAAGRGRLTLGVAVYPTHGTTRAALLARATASASSLD